MSHTHPQQAAHQGAAGSTVVHGDGTSGAGCIIAWLVHLAEPHTTVAENIGIAAQNPGVAVGLRCTPFFF